MIKIRVSFYFYSSLLCSPSQLLKLGKVSGSDISVDGARARALVDGLEYELEVCDPIAPTSTDFGFTFKDKDMDGDTSPLESRRLFPLTDLRSDLRSPAELRRRKMS